MFRPFLSLVLASGVSRSLAALEYEVYGGDMLRDVVPGANRSEADILTATSLSDNSRLWSGGRVNYVIDTTNPSAALALKDTDTRISASILEWETKTCIRFTKCATEASCTKPYIRFQYHVSACNSFVGVHTSDNINPINLAPECGKGATIHEIGHAMGLSHEQVRKDRDQYVAIDTTQIESGATGNFVINGASARDIGQYDYGSIMHYSATAFAIGTKPTIVTPYPTGQRAGLSTGDIAGIKFMYNDCSASYDAPQCVASVDATVTHVIPYSKAFSVEFNAKYSSSMAVTYASSTVPSARWVTSVSSGNSLGVVGFTLTEFTPTSADSDKIFTMAATFTSGSASSTCEVKVKVAATTTVCFGIPGDDATVCSGRGACGSDPLAPCTCTSVYGGLDCSGFATCPSNYLYPFDEDYGTWAPIVDAALESDISATGLGSWKVGNVGSSTRGQGILELVADSKPERVTFYLSRMVSDGGSPRMSFRAGSTTCFYVEISTVITVNDQRTTVAEADEFYFIDIRLDWTAKTTQLLVDGVTVATGVGIKSATECDAGINKVVFFGNGYLDEYHMWCTSYITTSGTASTIASADEIRNGGTTLTMSLVGNVDTWVDTQANKISVVNNMVADVTQAKGWNSVKASIINSGMVSFSGQVLTIGPFNAEAGYSTERNEVISLQLAGGMFTSGKLPLSTVREAGFTVKGSCAQDTSQAYDSSSELTTSQKTIATISTTTKKVGAGSVQITDNNKVLVTGVGGGTQPATLSWYARQTSTDSRLHMRLYSSGDTSTQVVEMDFGTGGGQIAWRSGSGSDPWTAVGSVGVNTWYFIEISFDWTARTLSLKVDTTTLTTGLAMKAGLTDVGTVSFFTVLTNTYVDDVRTTCPTYDPVYSITPSSCNTPGTDATTIKVLRGNEALSVSDSIVIVPSSSNCGDADAQCSSLGACASAVGVREKAGDDIVWSAGTLTMLAFETTYRVCYKRAAASAYTLLPGTFTTCRSDGTVKGSTPAPPTAAGDTQTPVVEVTNAPSPPATNTPRVTPTPGIPATSPPSTCDSSLQAACMTARTSSACASKASDGCLFCRTNANAQSCLYVNEVCPHSFCFEAILLSTEPFDDEVTHIPTIYLKKKRHNNPLPLQACGFLRLGLDDLTFFSAGSCPSFPDSSAAGLQVTMWVALLGALLVLF